MHRQEFFQGVLGSGYTVVVCHTCGAGFADGIPGQAQLDQYYSDQSKYTYPAAGGAESPYDLARFEQAVEHVMSYGLPRDARILDIGCATGGLLAAFQRRGFANVLGVDPSPACATAARRLHGIQVRTTTLAQLAHCTERFDLVLMLGVLEHLREVGGAVRNVATLLRPKGQIYVAVPDVEGLATARNAPFQQFSMEHVNFFSRASLQRLMAAAGLTSRQFWRMVVEWREAVDEPILAGLFQGDGGAPILERDIETRPALERYLDASRRGDIEIASRIDALVRSQEPVLIWGAGALTQRLLASTRLSRANIVAFIDSNPALQGKRLIDREIFFPEQVAGRSETILICSVAFAREILARIRHDLGWSNRLASIDGSF